jgi:TolB-like protein/class 3 adenylate cyclase/cytochrome c-type biogenesis protein CcmH/NrfG
MAEAHPGRVGRRLAAIVAADVAGYSRLMGLDEVGTARTLREHRKVTDALVAKHGGRLVKTTGDGVLLEFPSVVDAVECAVAVQAVMADRNKGVPEDLRMLFRIGINLGDILIEGDDILGDGVNVAARLEGIAEPGGICISSSAYEQVQGKVPVEFADLGDQELKNIARPIRAFAVIHDGRGVHTQAGRKQPSAPAPLSIVVLPFANIGGDAEQEFFADGVTDSLTTDLSRIPGSFVIARNTAFTFKGKAVDVKQVGRELKVRYVLEGSVQRGGNRLRLNVQLVDVETGKHFWAERFDKPVADLFDLQDEIVSRLANSLRYQLTAAEGRRSEYVLNPTSMDLYFQGWQHLNNRTTPDAVIKARECFERALILDPDNIEALVGKASVHTIIGQAIMAKESAPHFAAAEAALTDALSKNPQHAIAHLVLGSVYIYSGRALQGIAECERALAIDRNLANAHAFIGQAKQFLGRDEETEAHVNEALRLSPNDAFAFWWMSWVGFSKLRLGKFADAAVWFRRAIEVNRNAAWLHLGLAAALVQLDALEEARAATKEALALDPNCSLHLLRTKLPHINSAVLESLLTVGLPE